LTEALVTRRVDGAALAGYVTTTLRDDPFTHWQAVLDERAVLGEYTVAVTTTPPSTPACPRPQPIVQGVVDIVDGDA
jgi:hypothetical protein